MATTARVISFERVSSVYAALRLRAQVDNVPAAQLHKACQRALRVLDEGRSTALAVSEGVRAMRPVRSTLVDGPGAA